MTGRLWFLVHNCVAHPLMGLLSFSKPTLRVAYRFHKWTGAKAPELPLY